MNNLLDTFLNLTVFAFIGLLVWLYFRPLPSDEDNQRDTETLLGQMKTWFAAGSLKMPNETHE